MLLMNSGHCFRNRHLGGNDFRDPQRQHMTITRGDFHARHNFKGILLLLAEGPQAPLNYIMIGDRDDIQVPALRNIIQYLLWSRQTITQAAMHV
jgi:hypothetical protein